MAHAHHRPAGWVHHEQQRRKWVPAAVKLTAALAVGAYFAFMLSFTQGSGGGGGASGGVRAGAGAGLQSALTNLASVAHMPSFGGGARANGGKKVIGYAISVTADGPYMDGAAVLAHGIRKAMAESKYGYDLIALVYPNVSSSRPALERAGWKLVERDLPLRIEEIEGAFLREKIAKNGCCGASELLKLYAWLLTEYHRVVHLDMDSLVLQPMDELYDRDGVDFIYTCDYGMMTPGSKACPVQGGFFVLRPDPQIYAALVDVVREGDFREGSAWGGSGIGWFWGGMTIQGLLPYYFLHLADPARSFEADRCVYNNMFDNPECKAIAKEKVKNVHFTVCQKPWSCFKHDRNVACTPFLEKWYELRNELEEQETGAHIESCEHGRYRPMAFLQEGQQAAPESAKRRAA